MKVTVDGTLTVVIAHDPKLDQIISLLNRVIVKERQIMSTLDDLVTATAAQKTVLDSLVVFIKGLKDQIINGVTGLTAAQQAQLDKVFTDLNANTQEVADAMVENTPAA
jgi:hypothetical protein